MAAEGSSRIVLHLLDVVEHDPVSAMRMHALQCLLEHTRFTGKRLMRHMQLIRQRVFTILKSVAVLTIHAHGLQHGQQW